MFDNERDEQPIRRLDEYWSIIYRRRWYIVLPVFLVWAVVWGASWVVPAVYQSDALILVEQQKVPEQFVVPNVTVNLQDRLQTLTQQILSRTRLQSTINRFHLYESQRSHALSQNDDAVERMRKDIAIELVEAPGHPGQLTSFKIRYSATTPPLAQRVNSELTSLFIDENLKSQQQLSESTTAFLQNELSDARFKLEAQEAKVRAFKAQHFGNLPNQLETNVQILTGLQSQLQNTQRGLDGANQQKLYLESLLKEYQSVQASLGPGNSSAASPASLAKQLSELRLQLQEAQLRYTEDHPDVVKLKKRIAKIEELRQHADNDSANEEHKKDAADGVDPGSAVEVQRGSTSSMMQLQSQMKANRLEIQNYEQHEKKLEADISSYQARLNLTPETEQELADISRGYEESKANYNSLLQKQNQSQLATSLEQRQQGQQFRILDPPSLPTRPSAPNHLLLSAAGLLLGSIIGVGLLAFREASDVRVRKETDLEEILPVKVLVGIPHLDVPGEKLSRTLWRALELSAAITMIAVILAGNLYTLLRG